MKIITWIQDLVLSRFSADSSNKASPLIRSEPLAESDNRFRAQVGGNSFNGGNPHNALPWEPDKRNMRSGIL